MMPVHNEEVRRYVKDYVSPHIERLITELVTRRPTDVVPFCRKWFDDYEMKTKLSAQPVESDSDNEQAPAQTLALRKRSYLAKRRKAITTEVYSRTNNAEEVQPPIQKKSEQTKTRILIKLKDSFMFRNFDDQQTNSLIDAMPKEIIEAGTMLINSQEECKRMFVVDQGELESSFTVQGRQHILKTFLPGDSFGELALLYGHQSQQSVRARKSSVVYSLSRQLFSRAVHASINQKRQLLAETLPKIQVFQELDTQQLNQLVDTAKEICAYSNEYVVKEGESNQKVFIVSRGRLSAYKTVNDQKLVEENVEYYSEGSHFGIESFLTGEQSHVSIVSLVHCKVTQTNSKLFSIDRECLIRIVGPIDRILQRKSPVMNRQSNSTSMQLV